MAKSRVQDLNGVATDGAVRKMFENPPENHAVVAASLEELEAKNRELQKSVQFQQQQMQEMTAMHDLNSGNRDLMHGMQACGLACQGVTQLNPLLLPIFGDLSELVIEKDADYAYFNITIDAQNVGS